MQQPLAMSVLLYPRANGAKRRSGRKPGARVTNSARLSIARQSINTSCSENIVAFLVSNARGCCMHVLLVIIVIVSIIDVIIPYYLSVSMQESACFNRPYELFSFTQWPRFHV